jgi:hypothetical protein
LEGPQRAGRGHWNSDGNFKPHLVDPFIFVHETLLLAWNAEGRRSGFQERIWLLHLYDLGELTLREALWFGGSAIPVRFSHLKPEFPLSTNCV